MKLTTRAGYSLVELMVTVGIGSGLSLAMFEIISRTKNQVRFYELRESISEEQADIDVLLMQQPACVNTFGIPNIAANIAAATPAAPVLIPAVRDGAAAPGGIRHQPGVFALDSFPRGTPPQYAQFRMQDISVIAGNSTNANVLMSGQTLPPNSFMVAFRYRFTDNVGRSIGISNVAFNRDYVRFTVFQATFNGAGQVVSCSSNRATEFDLIFINTFLATPEDKQGNLDIEGGLEVIPNPAGDVVNSGYVFAENMYISSDENLKMNIRDVKNPLQKVENLRGVSFEWMSTHLSDWGVIAQELEQTLPHLVSKNKNIRVANYQGILAYNLEATKKLYQQQKEMDNELQQLERDLEQLRLKQGDEHD